jgi:hypothetical protein
MITNYKRLLGVDMQLESGNKMNFYRMLACNSLGNLVEIAYSV